jgi:hypothetical protein
MIDAELSVWPLTRGGIEAIVRPAARVQLLYEFVVGSPLNDALLVQHCKNPHVFHVDQIELSIYLRKAAGRGKTKK